MIAPIYHIRSKICTYAISAETKEHTLSYHVKIITICHFWRAIHDFLDLFVEHSLCHPQPIFGKWCPSRVYLNELLQE